MTETGHSPAISKFVFRTCEGNILADEKSETWLPIFYIQVSITKADSQDSTEHFCGVFLTATSHLSAQSSYLTRSCVHSPSRSGLCKYRALREFSRWACQTVGLVQLAVSIQLIGNDDGKLRLDGCGELQEVQPSWIIYALVQWACPVGHRTKSLVE